MIQRLLAIAAGSLFLCSFAFAQSGSFSIDDEYSAYFPEKPKFQAELGQGAARHRSYGHTDEVNLIVYTATYQAGKTEFSENEIPGELKLYTKGQAMAVGGQIQSYEARSMNGNESATVVIWYEVNGVDIRKFSVLSYQDGHFFQWTVQDFPTLSKLDGKTLFDKHLHHFYVH